MALGTVRPTRTTCRRGGLGKAKWVTVEIEGARNTWATPGREHSGNGMLLSHLHVFTCVLKLPVTVSALCVTLKGHMHRSAARSPVFFKHQGECFSPV